MITADSIASVLDDVENDATWCELDGSPSASAAGFCDDAPGHRGAAPMPRWKRAMDILGASVGLLVLAPLMLAVGVMIKLSGRGPVLFRQWRAGLHGEPFVIYKFRTMTADAERHQRELRHLNEQDGPTFKLRHDPRVTRLGRWLRRTSIDELPQLWNVLRGDMSLVGPRPLDVREVARCKSWHRQRHAVVPGITCIWQVRGRPRHCFDLWARMDIQYTRRRSLWLDLKLLLLTIPAIIRQSGSPW